MGDVIMKKYIKDATKIFELENDLQDISNADNKNIEDYTQKEVVEEAEYILSCFYEGGHMLNESLNSEDKEERKDAEKEVKQLKNYIKKYKE